MTATPSIGAGDSISVSVIMPFRDAADYLPRSLEALDNLCYAPEQIILVDDGSTDDSHAIAYTWASRRTNVTLVTHQHPTGVAEARDSAVEVATGDYVWFCDVDDAWSPSILNHVAQAASAANYPDVVACRARRVERDGRIRVMEGAEVDTDLDSGAIARAILCGRLRGYLWNKLIRRDTLQRACADAARRQRLSSQDDFLLLLDIARHAQRATLIPFIGYTYIEQPGSVSTRRRGADTLANTGHCLATAVGELTGRAGADSATIEGFSTWFYLVPCLSTPVHQSWPAADIRAIHRALLPHLTWAGIHGCWRMGHRSVAIHALLLATLGPVGAYPAVYRGARSLMSWSYSSSTSRVRRCISNWVSALRRA